MFKINTNVRATIFDGQGNVVRREIGHNALTDGVPASGVWNARVLLLMLLSGDNNGGILTGFTPKPYHEASLFSMELGTGTASDTGLGTPYGTLGDTDQAFEANPTWNYATPTAPYVTFTCLWGPSPAYGALSGITEVVFYNVNSDVFAFKNFSAALSKEAAGTIQLDWKITIS
jgi:hypothetical protein